METTQISINWSTDKQNVVYSYSGILNSHVRNACMPNECIKSADACYNFNKTCLKTCRIKEARHKRPHIILYLHEISGNGKPIVTGRNSVIARGWERGELVWLLNGHRVSIWGDAKVLVLELENGDNCTILWIYLMSRNYAL